jgi:hypothetical protein
MHRKFLQSALLGFPEELSILSLTGSVKPVQILQQRWRAYI